MSTGKDDESQSAAPGAGADAAGPGADGADTAGPAADGADAPAVDKGHAYELFILLLTILSLLIMVALALPWLTPATTGLLTLYDTVICIVFLFDFGVRLKRAPSRRAYFIGERGWLDLIGSIPSFGIYIQYAALLRLARLSRLARITRLLRGQQRRELVRDVLANRGQYAGFVTLVLAMTVLSVTSVLVLQAESSKADAHITSGGDAIWWAIVTLTTVGYGDVYPISPLGRVIAVLVMIAGVGIIAALASILASILIPAPEKQTDPVAAVAGLKEELAAARDQLAAISDDMTVVRDELAALRGQLAEPRRPPAPPDADPE